MTPAVPSGPDRLSIAGAIDGQRRRRLALVGGLDGDEAVERRKQKPMNIRPSCQRGAPSSARQSGHGAAPGLAVAAPTTVSPIAHRNQPARCSGDCRRRRSATSEYSPWMAVVSRSRRPGRSPPPSDFRRHAEPAGGISAPPSTAVVDGVHAAVGCVNATVDRVRAAVGPCHRSRPRQRPARPTATRATRSARRAERRAVHRASATAADRSSGTVGGYASVRRRARVAVQRAAAWTIGVPARVDHRASAARRRRQDAPDQRRRLRAREPRRRAPPPPRCARQIASARDASAADTQQSLAKRRRD